VKFSSNSNDSQPKRTIWNSFPNFILLFRNILMRLSNGVRIYLIIAHIDCEGCTWIVYTDPRVSQSLYAVLAFLHTPKVSWLRTFFWVTQLKRRNVSFKITFYQFGLPLPTVKFGLISSDFDFYVLYATCFNHCIIYLIFYITYIQYIL